MSNSSKSPNVIVHPDSQDLLDSYLGSIEKVLVDNNLTELEIDNLIVDVFHSILDLSTKYLPPQGPYYVTRPILQKVLEELGDPRDVARTFLDEYRSVSSVISSVPQGQPQAQQYQGFPPSSSPNGMVGRGKSHDSGSTRSIFLVPWVFDLLFALQMILASIQVISVVMLDPRFFFLDYSYPYGVFSSSYDVIVRLGALFSVLMFHSLLFAAYVVTSILSFHSIKIRKLAGNPCNIGQILRYKRPMDATVLFLSLIIFWYVFSAASFTWNALIPYDYKSNILVGKIVVFSFGILIAVGYFLLRTLDWSSPIESWQRFKSFRNAKLGDILEVFSLKYKGISITKREKVVNYALPLLHRSGRIIQLLAVAMMCFPLVYAIIFINSGMPMYGGFWVSYMGPFVLLFLIIDVLIRLEFLHRKFTIQHILTSSIEPWMYLINVLVHAIGVVVLVAMTQNVILALVILGADLYWLDKVYQDSWESHPLMSEKQPSSSVIGTPVMRVSESTATTSSSPRMSHVSAVPQSTLSSHLVASPHPEPSALTHQEYRSNDSSEVFRSLIFSVSIAVFYSTSLITVLTAIAYEVLVWWFFPQSNIKIIDVFSPSNDPIVSLLPFSPSAVFAFTLLLQFVYLVMAVYHRVTARSVSLSFRVVTYLMLLLVLIPIIIFSYGLYLAIYYQHVIYLRIPLWDYFIFIVGSLVFNFLIIIEKRQNKLALESRKENVSDDD